MRSTPTATTPRRTPTTTPKSSKSRERTPKPTKSASVRTAAAATGEPWAFSGPTIGAGIAGASVVGAKGAQADPGDGETGAAASVAGLADVFGQLAALPLSPEADHQVLWP